MISAQSVDFRYNNINKDFVIKSFSLELKRGEILAFLGKSGAGKSTIASIMAGLRNDKLTNGNILCDGVPLVQPNSRVALVLQNYRNAVYPWFNVERNIKLGFCKTNNKATIKDSMDEIIKIMGFTDEILNKNPSALSGGQQQKVQIARALATNCDFLILDEPSSSLDMEFREDLLQLLVKLKKEKNIGIMLVTHNIEEAVFVSDEIVLCVKDKLSNEIACSKRIKGFSYQVLNLAEAYKNKQFQEIFLWVHQNLFPD